jgi:hypothetical protein
MLKFEIILIKILKIILSLFIIHATYSLFILGLCLFLRCLVVVLSALQLRVGALSVCWVLEGLGVYAIFELGFV